MSYFKMRDMDNAEKCLEISNILDNENGDTWGMLSVICMIIGIGQNRGFRCYQTALKLGCKEPEVFKEIADLFSKSSGLEKEAINCFEISLTGEPNQEDLWIQYGDFMKKQGDIQKAIECYRSACSHINGDVKRDETKAKADELQKQLDSKETLLS